MDTYEFGNFSFAGNEEMMLRKAFEGVNNYPNGWDELKKDPGSDGFACSRSQIMINLFTIIDSTYGHSGCSLALTMRHMKYIATHGWEEYIHKYIPIYDKNTMNCQGVLCVSSETNINGEECIICLEQDARIFCKTDCNHVFHKACLEEWILNNRRDCPLCRKTIKKFSYKSSSKI